MTQGPTAQQPRQARARATVARRHCVATVDAGGVCRLAIGGGLCGTGGFEASEHTGRGCREMPRWHRQSGSPARRPTRVGHFYRFDSCCHLDYCAMQQCCNAAVLGQPKETSMNVNVQEYVAEGGELLVGQVRKFRENSVESVREAVTGSAETLKALKSPVRMIARSGVKLTTVSQTTVQNLIELQSDVVTSALNDVAAAPRARDPRGKHHRIRARADRAHAGHARARRRRRDPRGDDLQDGWPRLPQRRQACLRQHRREGREGSRGAEGCRASQDRRRQARCCARPSSAPARRA